MTKRGQWLRPDKAAQLVARRLGKSVGASLPILSDAMFSGEVRVRSVADPKNPEYLPDELWVDARFNLDRNIVIGADPWGLERGLNGECQYDDLEISGDDLEFWLQAHYPPVVKRVNDESGEALHRDGKADPKKPARKPRRDAKRSEIAQAIAALESSTAWQRARDGQRCQMVEKHLEKPKGWCNPRTLNRATTDRESGGSSA